VSRHQNPSFFSFIHIYFVFSFAISSS